MFLQSYQILSHDIFEYFQLTLDPFQIMHFLYTLYIFLSTYSGFLRLNISVRNINEMRHSKSQNCQFIILAKGEGYRFGVFRPAVRPSGCPSVRHKLVGAISQIIMCLIKL